MGRKMKMMHELALKVLYSSSLPLDGLPMGPQHGHLFLVEVDNILYAKTVKLMGDRTNAAKMDFSEIFPEDVEAELKGAAMISMGTEVRDIHLMNIKDLCNQVLSFSEYTTQLYDYLKSRMNTIAPNLTALVLRFLNTPNQMR
nr:probable nucleolar protein 5-2 [Ipomoea batatas]